ncbi:MAG: lectin-like protein, partial [Planctomycetota bacterium]|nr:lectin-like protein [Planctomycetota bacterium]
YGPAGDGTWNLYEVISTGTTWINAYNAAKARSYGGITGHLATVGSAAENTFLKNLITTSSWIGLTDSDTFASLGAYEAGNTSAKNLPAAGKPPVSGERGYGFVWVTGESFGYQNWSSGQPDDSGGEDAIEMYSADGKWNDNKSGETGQANGTTKQYIVEYDVGDRFVFGPYGPAGSLNFYQVVSETGTWQEAQDAAAASSQYGQAGHLVSINSAAENEFVRSLMGGAGWIGLTDGSAFGGTEMGDTSGLALPAAGQVPGAGQRGEGFVWTSGEPFTYQNWSAGQPDDGAGAGSQDAVEMATDGTWSDALTSGASRGVYVIEYDLGYTSANSRLVYGPYGPGGTWNLYEVVTGTTSWLDAYYAAKTSVERGKTGHLVSITSAAENNFVKSLLSTSAWIGLTDSGTFGGTEKGDTSGASLPPDGSAPTSAQRGYGFKWVTSESFTYQNWAGGQPDDGSGAGTQDGVALAVNGTWSDERDGEVGQTGVTADAYVIEYDLNQKFFYGPYGPGGTWNLYELAPTAMTWVDAKADAATQAQGGQTGHLVTVGSAAENNFIKSLVSADTWLGLTDSETFGGSEKGNTSALPLPTAGQTPGAGQRGEGFVWVTGDPFTYQNWNSGQPDDASPGQDAGYITTGGAWYDEMSGEGLQTGTIKQYVIEYETGLSAVGPLMKVERVSTVSNIPTVAEAVAVLNSRTPAVYYAPVVNFSDPQQTGGGRFGGDLAYPGDTPAADVTYALRVTGTIRIPTAGDWTFDVNSDDGASLRIIGQTFKSVAGAGTTFSGDTMLYSGTRGANTDSLGVTTLGVGEYQFELIYFQSTGGSMLEFSAAPGAYTSIPSPSPFRLVGDSLNGGLAVSGIPNLATTNLAAQMYGKNSSAYLRVPFTVAEDAAFNHLHLEMQYDDGFVAFIDGVEVARSNAPASLAWNSAATASRGGTSANTPHEFDIYRTLAPGNHVLAIQGLNASAADSDFLVLPELYGVTVLSTDLRYFTTPSPGWANSEGIAAFVKDTQFSNDRGFYTTPFDLTITSATAGATIRYTTDGSTPTSNTGTVYTGPLRIDHTTILRAAAFKTDWDSTDVDTETYLFISDIIGQSLNGQAPAGWPTGPINSQILDYGMDPDIVNNPLYWNLLYDALTEIPSISLVTDLSNLFDPLTGIYVNPKQDGSGWERPTSVELINPDGTDGFQIDAGLRIRGGYSRDPSNPKHGFRLIFKDQYDGTLHYALFGDEGVDQFENVDLRTSENYSWSFGGDSRNIMVRDLFNRMTQRDMGDPYTRSRFYHLYIDGEYWGIYMTEERPEADYAADYFGGDKDDYDVIKVDTDTYTMFATDGNLDAYTRLYNAAVAGFESNDAYLRVLGCNPDGTRNPAYEVQVDPVNLIDYMLSIYWSGDLDAPCSNFLGNLKPNNIYCIRDRTGDTGWQFFRHDGEHTLLDVNQNRVYGTTASPANTYFWTGGDQLQYFNPQWLHQKLMENAEYKQLFDDRVQKFFTNGGALTPEACLARFDSLTNMIDMAIVAESARWGDAKVTTPKTKVDWQTEVNRIRTAFIPQRTAIVLNQFNTTPDPHATTVPAPTLSWLSSVAAPTFSQFGGPIASVEPWFDLTITAPAGTIYYTLDGTDPRLLFGAKATGALLYTGPIELTKSTRIMARAAVDDGFGNLTWSALSDATFVRDTPSGLRITEVMYHPADPPSGSQYIDDDFQFIELLNTGAVPLGLAGYRLSDGVDFEFPDITVAPGQCFLVVANQDAFLSRYPTVPTGKIIGQFGGYLAQGGEYIQLDAGLDGTLQRFEYKDGWFADTDGEGFSLVVLNPGQDRALWDDKDGWRPSRAAGGSPGEADTDVAPGSMVINEILAHQDTEAPGDWIELKNVSAAAIDISGWFLSD